MLATAVRKLFVLGMFWLMTFFTHSDNEIWIFQKNIYLSGLAAGTSWLYYCKVLQLDEVSKVVPIDKMSVIIKIILVFIFLHKHFS